MIDLEDPELIEALNRAGWVKIEEDDVVINRSILQTLIFSAGQTGNIIIPAKGTVEE